MPEHNPQVTAENMKKFSIRLKAARQLRGFETAAEFARHIKMDVHTYRHWEAARACPDIHSLLTLCKALDVEPNELLPFNRQSVAA